jgi:hypothetical protein
MQTSQKKRRYERPTFTEKGQLEKIVAISGSVTPPPS